MATLQGRADVDDRLSDDGVKMDEPSPSIITNTVLHDKSSNLFGAPSDGPTLTARFVCALRQLHSNNRKPLALA